MKNRSLFDRRPILVAVAGPNGAGKSTFYEVFLRQAGLRYVNADDIARELQIDAYEAARFAEQVRQILFEAGESFVFETVFSDPAGAKLAFLASAKEKGYTVVLVFIGVDADASEERVAMRVAKGGHDVPTEKLATRHPRTMRNLKAALRELPNVLVYDNSDLAQPYTLVAEYVDGALVGPDPRPPPPPWFAKVMSDGDGGSG
ncbi:MAG TPA: zeta toxin family protein [Anaeromyxobacteraceae bacterium]